MSKDGFTLVELSIVLVIIGLLISGILVGQSLIDSANIQNFIRQTNQYIIAIRNFETKFGQLPGDSDLFTNPSNNDGRIEYPGSGATGEWTRAWAHLSESNILQKVYTGVAPGIVNNGEVPESDVFKKGYYTVSGNTPPHHFRVGHQDNTGAMNSGGVMTPLDLMSIDSKLDDGLPFSGIVRPIRYAAFEPNCLINTTGGGSPFTSGDYNINNSDALCSFFMHLDF